ncbi:hypothetical protein B0J13DRAFT_617463 [Dactylonectria estremocensis]|uniref:Peptidase M20 dimerisation domain-containing protein n=1 Tax=Dactylonectria estremocensis TaxID=1079267 RepID=A0A9P9F9U5_9HYPO|nr:hypothetical protein B0J13DRAFT_617463 [Dactylonectria estremocensis]
MVLGHKPDLALFEALSRTFHWNADPSSREYHTTGHIASALAAMVLRFECQVGGAGVAGVLSGGKDDKTILPRAELDQLTMHVCGHDLHIACLLAAAALFQDARAEWNGTVTILFLHNEEHTGGAQAVTDGGLSSQVSVPCIVLGQHSGRLKACTLDALRIAGLRSQPSRNIDPVKLASKIIVKFEDLAKEIAGDHTTDEATIRQTFASFFGDSNLRNALAQVFDNSIRTDTFLDKIPICHSIFNSPTLYLTLEVGIGALALATLTFLVG